MQRIAVVIPADIDLPIEVKQYDDSTFTVLYELIGLAQDETLGFTGLGDRKHQLVLDDNGLLQTAPVLNPRAMTLMGAMMHCHPNELSPLVGNMAILGNDEEGEAADVAPEVVELIQAIEKEYKK